MPRLRQLLASLLLPTPNLGPHHMQSLVDEVEMEQNSSPSVHQFSTVSIIPKMLQAHSLTNHHYTISATD
jgi:hypothetical protein